MAFLKNLVAPLGYGAATHTAKRAFGTHHESQSKVKADIKAAQARTLQSSPYTKGQQHLINYMTKAAVPGSHKSAALGTNLGQNPLYQQATSLLGQYLNPSQEMINQMQAPQLRQYREQILPEIAQQYASAGGLSSSSFANAATNSAADLQERLNAQQLQMQQGALSQALGYAEAPGMMNLNVMNQALSRAPNQYTYIPPQPKGGMLRALLPALGSAGGAFAGSYVGQPAAGAAAGGAFGNTMSQSNPYAAPSQRFMSAPINNM